MDNLKTDKYYIEKILKDLKFIIEITQDKNKTEIEQDEILTDSILFRIIQVSENCTRLDKDFLFEHSSIPWRAIKGMRNMIVHNYGAVDLEIVYDTVKNSIPKLYNMLKNEHI